MTKFSNLNVYESQLCGDKKLCLDDTRITKTEQNYQTVKKKLQNIVGKHLVGSDWGKKTPS